MFLLHPSSCEWEKTACEQKTDIAMLHDGMIVYTLRVGVENVTIRGGGEIRGSGPQLWYNTSTFPFSYNFWHEQPL